MASRVGSAFRFWKLFLGTQAFTKCLEGTALVGGVAIGLIIEESTREWTEKNKEMFEKEEETVNPSQSTLKERLYFICKSKDSYSKEGKYCQEWRRSQIVVLNELANSSPTPNHNTLQRSPR